MDLVLLDRDQITKLEPNIRAVAAILSPSTGIIDSHKLMLRLEWLALEHGAIISYNHEVIGVAAKGNGYHVTYRSPTGELESIHCDWLINCQYIHAVSPIFRFTTGYGWYKAKTSGSR
jgi:L-2-hydroxyglutarate oxidase LhgO